MTANDEDLDTFECPRCGRTAHERFWGPCGPCREQLVAAYAAERSGGEESGGEVESSRFEPAMHVVPNHVATKD